MQLADLVSTSRRIASTRKRSHKIEALVRLLTCSGPDEVAAVATYLTGTLPHGRIGVGYATVHRTSAVAPVLAPVLTIQDVTTTLTQLTEVGGSGSNAERMRLLGELFARATEAEQEFLRRLLTGELRQGALEGIMVEAVAAAARVPAEAVRRALMLRGELGVVAAAAMTEGAAGLARFRLTLFRPLQPMLAQPAGDVEEALAALGEAALELKLDGARVQVHRRDGDVRIFSREGNDVTAAVPEIVELARALPSSTFVLDGEAIALRPDGSPLPFQTTMRRFGRRLDIEALRASLPLSPFFFDVLHLEGQDLIDAPWRERIRALDALLPPRARVARLVTASAGDAEAFYDHALRSGHEGLIAKSPMTTYEAGRRGAGWLKVKPARTLDLVVLAAEWGSGRRRGWLSNLHLGARDPVQGGFVMLGKTFKGMTDAMLAWQTRWLLAHEIGRDAYTVYVQPELVVEVAFDTVQASPHYPGGLALRFARVKRYREDKRAAEADTVDTIRTIFEHAHGIATARSG